MDSWVTRPYSRAHRLAEPQVGEVLEEGVVDVLDLIWMRLHTGPLHQVNICRWEIHILVPQTPLDDAVNRVSFRLSMPLLEVLLNDYFVFLHGEQKKCIAKNCIPVLIPAASHSTE